MIWLNLLIGTGALQGIFLAFLLFRLALARNNPPLNWLGGFVGAFSLLVLSDVLLQTRAILELPHLYLAFDFLVFWLGPLCYGYVRSLLGFAPWPWLLRLLHFIPGLMLLALIAPNLFVSTANKRALILSDFALTPQESPDLVILSAGLFALGYLLRSLFLIREYWRDLESQYSNTEKFKLSWLGQLLALCAVLWVTWMVSILWSLPWADLLAQLGLGFGVYALGYRGLKQPRLWSVTHAVSKVRQEYVENSIHKTRPLVSLGESPLDGTPDASAISVDEKQPAAPSAAPPKYAKAGNSTAELAAIGDKISELMRNELAFLEPELSLTDLARRVDVSPHTLSQTLNAYFGLSFFEYINTLRVKEVQRCFADPAFASQSILDIALASGFSSKATFNATFKRLTGLTPSVSRRQLIGTQKR